MQVPYYSTVSTNSADSCRQTDSGSLMDSLMLSLQIVEQKPAGIQEEHSHLHTFFIPFFYTFFSPPIFPPKS